MADNLYYWDEISLGTFRRKLLGEIISDFNFGLSIDGAKDSAKLNIVSYTKNQVKPYTIIEHEKTNTWWVVASDRIDRFQNDDGFYYYHELELVGAIELLNTCDLTDCGFYANRYTINDIINRLLKLSVNSHRLPTFLIVASSIDLNQMVNYTKTFENYTLLSALREMFDGYNCAIKLEFEKATSSGLTYLSNTKIKVISKTGDGTIVQESVFNFVQEKTHINKNNYGTSVVSNAQNVISTKPKTYPTVGSVRLFAHQYKITPDNAVLRLPSPVYDVNWVKLLVPISININNIPIGIKTNYTSPEGAEKLYEYLVYAGVSITYGSKRFNDILNKLKRACTIRFDAGSTFNTLNTSLVPPTGKSLPYFIKYNTVSAVADFYGYVALLPKQLYDGLNDTNKGIYWERGSDEIKGFRFLGNVSVRNSWTALRYWEQTELGNDGIIENVYVDDELDAAIIYRDSDITISLPYTSLANFGSLCGVEFDTSDARFVVNYIPMVDLKVKYDNNQNTKLSNLYNQTGKLTDSVALSKLMLSHSKEIESDKITKYASFYDFNSIPKVGNVVNINNEKYVIGNISLDFQQNEYDKYFITGEFTLSKAVATKSLLTNPDTNIRDYNIPQNYNVKRKQLYRDFYEITHTRENSATPIQNVDNVINVSNTYVPYAEHTAVIKLTYDGQVGGDENGNGSSNTWYYQLDSFTFVMKKSIYEVVDFKDNNIIGYDAMNVRTGFKINEILTHTTDSISTPISYVDDYGKVKNIEIAFCNSVQLASIYDNFEHTYNIPYEDVSGGLVNYSIFISSGIYEGMGGVFLGAKDYNDFKISEINYNKDATEVPVFEYSCQLDDSKDVIVGDNIFDGQEDDLCYFYSMYLVDKGTIDNNNATSIEISDLYIDDDGDIAIYGSDNSIQLEIGGPSNNLRNIRIKRYSESYYLTQDEQFTYYDHLTFDSYVELLGNTKDIVIIRHTVKKGYVADDNDIVPCTKDLMFVIKNLQDAQLDSGDIVLQLNCYNVN